MVVGEAAEKLVKSANIYLEEEENRKNSERDGTLKINTQKGIIFKYQKENQRGRENGGAAVTPSSYQGLTGANY